MHIESTMIPYGILALQPRRVCVPKESAWTIVIDNTGLVYSIVKRYCHHSNDFDDLVQEGLLGLHEAARRFNPTMNCAFSTYAYPWITKYVLGYYQSRSDDSKNDQFDEQRDAPTLSSCEAQFVRGELRVDLQRNLRQLDEVTRLVVFMRWLAPDKPTLKNISVALDVTLERVRQIEEAGLRQLHQLMSKRRS